MLGALIGAGASLASSLLGGKSSKDAAKSNAANQREFAQKGIQWKVEDAKKAGVHPLYALGANTHSFSPTAVGQDFSGIASAGQDIGRAIDATGTGTQRGQALALHKVQLEGLQLDNDIKRAELASRIATTTGAGVGPSYPGPSTRWLMDGQGNGPKMDDPKITTNTRRDAHEPGAPHSVAGAGPSVGFILNPHGGYSPVIPPELAESFEQDWWGAADWQWRNRITPMWGSGEKPNIPRLPWQEPYYSPYFDWRLRDNPNYGRFNTRR